MHIIMLVRYCNGGHFSAKMPNMQTYTIHYICDMIKGNESLVENFNSYFLASLSHNFNNWISGYRVMKNLLNNIK